MKSNTKVHIKLKGGAVGIHFNATNPDLLRDNHKQKV